AGPDVIEHHALPRGSAAAGFGTRQPLVDRCAVLPRHRDRAVGHVEWDTMPGPVVEVLGGPRGQDHLETVGGDPSEGDAAVEFTGQTLELDVGDAQERVAAAQPVEEAEQAGSEAVG